MSKLSTEIHPIFTKSVLEALNNKRIFTTINFIETETQQIIKIANLTFKDVIAIRKCLLKKYSAILRNGHEYYQDCIKNCAIIQTGIANLDAELLGGGLFTGNIYEICGAPACGKTQFCLTIAKKFAIKMNQVVYYLDTNRNFSAKKLKSMLTDISKEDFIEIFNKILIKNINTYFELINNLYEIKNKIENDLKTRLIIIDSLPSLILQSSNHVENNAILNHLSNIMRYIAVEYHVTFLVTNIVTNWSDGDFMNPQATKEVVACGRYWFGIPNCRLKLDKVENSLTISMLKCDDCSNVGKNINVFITNEGVVS